MPNSLGTRAEFTQRSLMVPGALLHPLRTGLDSAYNYHEDDQTRDHYHYSDARTNQYPVYNAVSYAWLMGCVENGDGSEFGAVLFVLTDEDLYVCIAIHAFTDHFEAILPEFLFTDVDVKPGSQRGCISQPGAG